MIKKCYVRVPTGDDDKDLSPPRTLGSDNFVANGRC